MAKQELNHKLELIKTDNTRPTSFSIQSMKSSCSQLLIDLMSLSQLMDLKVSAMETAVTVSCMPPQLLKVILSSKEPTKLKFGSN